jgi:hypothetical protein
MKGNSFDEMLQAKAQKQKTVEADELGECASPPKPDGWPGLYVLSGKHDTRAFSYLHMGYANYSADGMSFVVEFNEPEKWRLSVKGRKLWTVFVNIHQHALEWIKKADRDFAADHVPVITDIRIDRVAEDGSHAEEQQSD